MKTFYLLTALYLSIDKIGKIDAIKTAGDCGTQKIVFPPFESVCRNKENLEECRYLEVNKPVCDELPCIGNMTMTLDVKKETPPSSCCKTCMCYGDPHCESFSGAEDDFVICDARNKLPKKDKCNLNKGKCLHEKDFYGNQCIWKTNKNNKEWIIGLQGSQCTFNESNGNPAPNILMYKIDNFSINILLGERGVITEVQLKLNSSDYNMSAKSCFKNHNNPWTSEINNQQSSNPQLSSHDLLTNGDIRWNIKDINTEISVVILCTRNNVNGKFGAPRLNIESVAEPFLNDREQSVGFCVENVINKGLATHGRTDFLKKTNACGNKNEEELQIGKNVCDFYTDIKNINECKQNWCKNNEQCLNNINIYGWRKVWCSVNTLKTLDASKCTGNCKACYNEIEDFGYSVGMSKWENFATKSESENSNPCLNLKSFSKNLNECDEGISIQYEDKVNGTLVWKNYISIPESFTICKDVVFNSFEHPELFANRVRVKQCPVSLKCTKNRCNPEHVFELSLNYKKAPDMCVCENQL